MTAALARRGDWMQTFTGRRFWPLDPHPDDIDIVDIAHALSLLTRYGGHCLRFYSVAEHSVHIARRASPGAALPALLHDAGEAYAADIVRPLKRQMPEYRAIESGIERAVAARFDLDMGPHAREVKALDNRILMDERAQVMRPTADTWHFDGETEPLGVTLEFWSSERVEREFLSLFAALTVPHAAPRRGCAGKGEVVRAASPALSKRDRK